MDTTAKHPLASLSPNKPLAVSPSKMAAGRDKAEFDSGAECHSKMLQSKLSGQKYIFSLWGV